MPNDLHYNPEVLAETFHRTYETFAPVFAYHTRKASAVPWKNVPPKNKLLMIAVCREIQKLLNIEDRDRELSDE